MPSTQANKMKENIIQTKSFDFAVKMMRFCKKLRETNRAYSLADQLLNASCSIGANVEEAIGTNTKRHFHAIITISYKEAREAHFYLRAMIASGIYSHHTELAELNQDVFEIMRILSAIQKTTRENLRKENESK